MPPVTRAPRRWRVMILLSLLLGSITVAALFWPGHPQAPDIELAAIDGSRVRLSSLKGHPVLVSFWASDCRACLEELPILDALYRDYAPRGFRLLTVAMAYDPPSRVVALARERQFPYPVMLDPLGLAARAFGQVPLIPRHFLIDAQGRIRLDLLGKINPARFTPLLTTLLEEH
ncbi:TlpA family protein disulfide reductase [Candidatus Woesearchaeota archaeon]|nr:TlpA family protein disulfide reductase [Candidatus Woesearchaeota archaeon]